VAALERAVEISPQNAALQHACARAMIQDGRYADAYEHYRKMLRQFPKDSDALVNYGVLAARVGHPDEAEASWEKAVRENPNEPNAQLYLAQLLDQKGDLSKAMPHWRAFLQLAALHPDDPIVSFQQQIQAEIQLGDDEARSGAEGGAISNYRSAISMAERNKESRLESAALARLADLDEKMGDSKGAVSSYEQSLALDQKSGDAHGEAYDWFNYGQFLSRHRASNELIYACFVRAQNLLADSNGQEIETVKAAVREFSTRLGKKTSASTKNLPQLLARAANLPAGSF
jgi:tetratricopeptide (TPR) repeat protein